VKLLAGLFGTDLGHCQPQGTWPADHLDAPQDLVVEQSVPLAALVEVNPQTIGALERGDHDPSLDLALRVFVVLDPAGRGGVRPLGVTPLTAERWNSEGMSG